MKIVGLLLVVLTGTMAGFLKSSEYKNRVRQLEAILAFLQAVITDIRYRAAPLGELINRMTGREEFEKLVFLKECCALCEDGYEFPEAWKKALQTKSHTGALKKEEIRILLSFGVSLGTTDVEGQIANCQLHIQMINEVLDRAIKERDTHGKLYLSLGTLAGIGVAILLA